MSNKKINKILIGTNNVGKLREIKALLPKSLKIYSTKDFKLKSPIENGKSFLENSLIKAKFFSIKSKLICLADDSGLSIDILNGAPGIYSSRWAGKNSNFNFAIKKVFRELDKKDKNWRSKKINANFICALTIYFPNKKSVQSVGRINGFISNKKKGKNGFGYDPIFIPKGYSKTFAEMNYIEKLKIDHRQVAYQKLFKKIKVYF